MTPGVLNHWQIASFWVNNFAQVCFRHRVWCWVVVLRGWHQTLHSECPWASSGPGVKQNPSKADISEPFWRVCIQALQFAPVCERECPGCTGDKWHPLAAWNTSQNTRLQLKMRLCNFYFCFPSGFLQEKKSQKSWHLTPRDAHISLLTEQHGARPFHPSQHAWNLSLAASDLGSATLLGFFCSLAYLGNKTLTQKFPKLLIFFD